MPRDPSGSYTYPDGTRGISGQTIYSARYNTFLDDLAFTLNTALPVNMGGTNADDVAEARSNLKTEVSLLGQTVTNYDTHTFESGSFFSNAGAINSPDGAGAATNTYFGIAYGDGANNVVIEARNITGTGINYMRKKVGGVWGAWTTDAGEAAFVKKTGDTMTGNLTISPAAGSSELKLVYPGTSVGAVISSLNTATKLRWRLFMGDGSPESTGDAGSNLLLQRFNDAGTVANGVLSINRVNGTSTFTAVGPANAGIVSIPYIQTYGQGGSNSRGAVILNQAADRFLIWDGTQYRLDGAQVQAVNGRLWGSSDGTPFWNTGGTITGNVAITANNLTIGNGAVTPSLIFNGSSAVNGGSHLTFQKVGTPHWYAGQRSAILADGSDDFMFWSNTVGAGLVISRGNLDVTVGGKLNTIGLYGRAGSAGAVNGYDYNFNWTGSALQGWVQTTLQGNVSFVSDYRTKKDVADLGSTWDAVKALRPISYTQKEYTPDHEKTDNGPMFVEDNEPRWGFIAHELQDALLPTAATGHKDASGLVQSPNWPPIVAALTKALQEAMTRIEALEAKLEEVAHG